MRGVMKQKLFSFGDDFAIRNERVHSEGAFAGFLAAAGRLRRPLEFGMPLGHGKSRG